VAEGPAGAAGERLLRHFLALLGDVSQPGPLLGLVRSAVTSEHAARLLRQFLADGLLADIAAALPADRPRLGPALAASQLVGLAVTRYAVRLPPLTAAGTEDLVGTVAPVLQYYLTGQPISPKENS
jgi:hypothetical protein